ncbi:hypothetical protein, partial [Aquimarina gracilis]|uniref:hypothetical protein n=1 Tax=Aquimarina gracilis TaxID=874422 RepID=UPI0031D7C0AA
MFFTGKVQFKRGAHRYYYDRTQSLKHPSKSPFKGRLLNSSPLERIGDGCFLQERYNSIEVHTDIIMIEQSLKHPSKSPFKRETS